MLYIRSTEIFTDIYFINVTKLIERLKSGSFGEAETLKHLIVVGIIGGIGINIPISVSFTNTEPNGYATFMEIALFIISGVITYYGYWLVYQANSKGDGKDFFLRIAALSLPVIVRLLIYAIVFGLLLFILSSILANSLDNGGISIISIAFSIFGTVIVAAYFFMMRNYIAEISAYKEPLKSDDDKSATL